MHARTLVTIVATQLLVLIIPVNSFGNQLGLINPLYKFSRLSERDCPDCPDGYFACCPSYGSICCPNDGSCTLNGNSVGCSTNCTSDDVPCGDNCCPSGTTCDETIMQCSGTPTVNSGGTRSATPIPFSISTPSVIPISIPGAPPISITIVTPNTTPTTTLSGTTTAPQSSTSTTALTTAATVVPEGMPLKIVFTLIILVHSNANIVKCSSAIWFGLGFGIALLELLFGN